MSAGDRCHLLPLRDRGSRPSHSRSVSSYSEKAFCVEAEASEKCFASMLFVFSQAQYLKRWMVHKVFQHLFCPL